MLIDKLLLTHKEIFELVFDSIEQNKNLLLSYLNQNSLNICFRNERYKELLETGFNVYQADSGMYYFMKYLMKKNAERIDGTTLNTNILNEIINRKIPVSIIGGNFSESFLKEECEKRKIKLRVYHHGYFKESESETAIKEINKYPGSVVFVGMGVPKQELFAYELSRSSENKIILCTGNFFEFYFGTVKRAPQLFRKLRMEWIYRLIIEPKRLCRRYLLGIPEFIYRAIKLKLEILK